MADPIPSGYGEWFTWEQVPEWHPEVGDVVALKMGDEPTVYGLVMNRKDNEISMSFLSDPEDGDMGEQGT